jgi:WD40 repeat protein/predicted Ser/Thr protein kinase
MSEPLPARGDLSRLLDDQRRRWAGGERVLVEDYLPTFAHVLADPDALLDLLYHEVVVREEVGDAPELGEYVRRFPQFGRQLRDQFAVHAALRSTRWLERSGSRRPGAAVTQAGTGPEAAGAEPSIPGYEVIRELGRGGMGVVYLAWQTGLARLVALKMILAGARSRPQDRARFQDEAEAIARLEHPNLVRIYEVGAHDGRPYFSMEYVGGGPLTDSLRGAPWPPRRAAELAETLACAAHAAHERGVVHRDLTPHNVLLTAGGAPKIVDFGLAKLVVGGACRTETGAILGTPSYMAPEQAGGRSQKVGPAADVYALGAILYELLTGRPPFQAETPLDTLVQALHDEPVTPRRLQPTVPRDLETICLKCLDKEPARRYPSASALADDLHRFLVGEPVRARPVGAAGRAVRWARRRPTVAALLAVCTIIAAVGVAAATWEGRAARFAQRRAEQAQEAEKTQRLAAEAAGAQVGAQRRLYQRLSARLLRDRALRSCEDGDSGRGLLWLAQSLQLVPDDDPDLQRAIRTNLQGWMGQIHPLLGLLEHDDRVATAAWSPDGCLILTAGTDRTARLWDAATGQPRGRPLPHPRGVSTAAYSPDGAAFLTVSGQELRLWKTATGEPAVPPALDLGRGTQYLSHAFSRDGRRLWVATRRGQMACLQSWETATGQSCDADAEIGNGVTRVTFSPDGRVFVSSGESGEVRPRLWKTATGEPVRDLKEHTRFGIVVAFAKDGRSFVTGSSDHTCRLWDAATGEPLTPPFRHLAEVRAVAISPNGRTILAGGSDGLAQFWDVVKGTSPGAPMRHPDAVGPVGFSPDGRFALTVSRDQVYLWDAGTGEPLGIPLPHPKEVLSASFGPDGRAVLTRSRDHTVRVWQTDPVRPGGRRLQHHGWVTAVAFRPPAGASFLTGLGAREGKVLSWDTASGRGPNITFERLGPILSLTYRPDGRMFAVGTRDREVRFWDVEAGRPARANPLALDGRVLAVAFSPDGRTLLTGTEKRRAEFWDVTTGEKRPGPLEHDKAVYAVAYSPDGRTVMTGSEDMTVRLWDAATHEPVGVPLLHQGTVHAVAFRPPDGRVLLTGSEDRTARLWDAATGRPLGAPFQHPARVLAVAFSPDGRTFATGCGDGLVRLWETATGYPIGLPLRHRGPVRAVAFGPGPRDAGAEGGRWTLVTGSEDKTARCWEFSTPLTGTPDRILLAVQVAHGLELDAQGVAEPLPPATWWRMRREVLAAGGPMRLQPRRGQAAPEIRTNRGLSFGVGFGDAGPGHGP